jgi:hypothetical protein
MNAKVCALKVEINDNLIAVASVALICKELKM